MTSTFVFMVLLERALWSFIAASCDDDWYSSSEHCYYLSTVNVTWYEANTRCQQMESNLTSVLDKDEELYIAGIWNISSADYWIGLRNNPSQTYTSGLLGWSDGNKLQYNPSYLNGTETTEYCVRIYSEGDWRATKCNTSYDEYPFYFICKKDKHIGNSEQLTESKAKISVLHVAVGVTVTVAVVALVTFTIVLCVRRRSKSAQRTGEHDEPSTRTLAALYDARTASRRRTSALSIRLSGHPDNNNTAKRASRDASGSTARTSVDNPAYDGVDDDVFFTPSSGSPCDVFYTDELEIPDDPDRDGGDVESPVRNVTEFDLNDVKLFENLAYENRIVY